MRKISDWFTIIKIRPNLFALAEFKHDEKVISYLWLTQEQAILFDTGMGIGNLKKVVISLTNLPITVFLTHNHWDHVGGVASFTQVYAFNKPIINEQKTFKLEKNILTVIPTPGHTPDSVCFFISSLNWLFTGDTLYPGPLYLHLPESNLNDFGQSLDKLNGVVNKETLFLPGHNKTPVNYNFFKAVKEGYEVAKKMKQEDSRKNKFIFKGFSILTS